MSTNIEARALADILYEMIGTHVEQEYDRETASEARAGGRQLTKQIAEKRLHYGQAFVHQMTDDPTKTWHYQLDPSGSYQPGDPRREPEARASWARIARHYVEDDRRTRIYLEQAEAMVSWPIYRAALAEETYVAGFMSGGANERANVAFTLSALWGQASPEEERILDTLAHCAGLDVPWDRPGPVVNGERFAPGYTPEAAKYEQATRDEPTPAWDC